MGAAASQKNDGGSRFACLPCAPRRPVRGYIDGCFDLMHSGHYNAIRQAKQLCDILVVGIHSDEEIKLAKGPPVMLQEERYELLRHIKWADELLFDVPYSPSLHTLELARADFCIHGDDLPVGVDGRGAYDDMRDAGKLRIVKRTEGVSTTDMVDRLLLLAKDALSPEEETEIAVRGGHRHLLATTRRISEFSSHRAPAPDDIIVYISGTFDLFHVGHARLLQRAREFGTFLIVGVHDDEAMTIAGCPRPIMNLHERVLNVCACRHVDELIIGAPLEITEDLLTTMKVDIVVECQAINPMLNVQKQPGESGAPPLGCSILLDAYAVPRNRGILRQIEEMSPSLTSRDICQRVASKHDAYVMRNQVRAAREDVYYYNKSASQLGVIEQ